MRQSRTLDIGMDVQTASLAVASVSQDHDAEVVSLGPLGTRPCDMAQLVRTRPSQAQHLVFVSEAGPCGSWRSRDLTKQGQACWVVAPALLPQKAGDRVHPDRRDAVPLARLVRSGDLTPVYVPTGADAALRDLSRAREDPMRDLNAATFRLKAVLLRQDIRYTGRAPWGPAPLRWRAAGVCPTPAPPMVVQASVRAVTEPTARLQRLEQARHDHGHTWRLPPVVEALQALRGVQCIVAVPLGAARGETPRPLMTALGLIPSAYSSGERRRQGPLPTAGNPHARRALVEGAWASRDPANVSRPIPLRLAQRPTPIQDIRGKAHGRLGTRVRRLLARGTHATHVVVAMARERVGLLWAMAKPVPLTPEVHQTAHQWLHHAVRLPRLAEEAPPQCGATLAGVTRPAGLLEPRVRPAPDGGPSGGCQPTARRRITRRLSWLRLFRWITPRRGQQHAEHRLKIFYPSA